MPHPSYDSAYPALTGSTIALSNGNKTATRGSGSSFANTLIAFARPKEAGFLIFGLRIVSLGTAPPTAGDVIMGVGSTVAYQTNYFATRADGWQFQNNGNFQIYNNGSPSPYGAANPTTGDAMFAAIRFHGDGTFSLWGAIQPGATGSLTWYGDPVANTGAAVTNATVPAGGLRLVCNLFESGDVVELLTDENDISGDRLLTGFQGWGAEDDPGINPSADYETFSALSAGQKVVFINKGKTLVRVGVDDWADSVGIVGGIRREGSYIAGMRLKTLPGVGQAHFLSLSQPVRYAANHATALPTAWGLSSSGLAFTNSTSTAGTPQGVEEDVMLIAWAISGATVKFWVGRQAGGTGTPVWVGDPAAGTGEMYSFTLPDEGLVLLVNSYYEFGEIDLLTTAVDLSGRLLTGFYPYAGAMIDITIPDADKAFYSLNAAGRYDSTLIRYTIHEGSDGDGDVLAQGTFTTTAAGLMPALQITTDSVAAAGQMRWRADGASNGAIRPVILAAA